MALVIPNAGDSTGSSSRYATLDQSEPDSVDFEILGNAGRSGVVSGCSVISNNSNSNVTVEAGRIILNGVSYSVPSSIVAIPAGPLASDDPPYRFDLVIARVANSSVTIVVKPGFADNGGARFPRTRNTASTYSSTDDIDLETDVVLASLFRSLSSPVGTAEIVDKRIMLSSAIYDVGSAEPTGGSTGSLFFRSNRAQGSTGSGVYVKNSLGDWLELGQNIGPQVPVGSVVAWAATGAIPSGWLECNGQSYSRTDPATAELYAVIGTTYGSSSATTFNVPNLNNKFIRGTTSTPNLGSGGGSNTASVPVPEHRHTHDHSHGMIHYHAVDHSHAASSGGNSNNHTHGHGHTHSGGTSNQSTSHSHNYLHDHNGSTNNQSTSHSHNYYHTHSGGTNNQSASHSHGMSHNHNAATNSAGTHWHGAWFDEVGASVNDTAHNWHAARPQYWTGQSGHWSIGNSNVDGAMKDRITTSAYNSNVSANDSPNYADDGDHGHVISVGNSNSNNTGNQNASHAHNFNTNASPNNTGNQNASHKHNFTTDNSPNNTGNQNASHAHNFTTGSSSNASTGNQSANHSHAISVTSTGTSLLGKRPLATASNSSANKDNTDSLGTNTQYTANTGSANASVDTVPEYSYFRWIIRAQGTITAIASDGENILSEAREEVVTLELVSSGTSLPSTATQQGYYRLPWSGTLTGVKATLDNGGNTTEDAVVDVKRGGTSLQTATVSSGSDSSGVQALSTAVSNDDLLTIYVSTGSGADNGPLSVTMYFTRND